MKAESAEMLSSWEAAVKERPALSRWFSHWQGSLNGAATPLQDELPWMTYAAISWLEGFLNKEMTVFEWGSGGSSAFFAKRAERVVSVEHDPAWLLNVKQALTTKEYTNAEISLVQPLKSGNPDPWYSSSSPDYLGCCFQSYASAIDSYPDESFDLVVVDGRGRPGCMRHAIPKVKRGGFILLDNSERAAYQSGCSLLEGWSGERMWGPGPYNGYPWETRIWRRPSC